MYLRLATNLFFLVMTVLGSTVQPEDYHHCMDPKINIGNSKEPCQKEGQFRNYLNRCQNCTIQGPNTMVVSECNGTHDSVFKCNGGTYVRHDPYVGGQCVAVCPRCSMCGVGHNLQKSYAKEGGCQGYQDTICCEVEEDIHIAGKCLDPQRVMDPPTTTKEEVTTHISSASYHWSYRELICSMILCIALFRRL